jgi:CRP-like cAMP-binding protein
MSAAAADTVLIRQGLARTALFCALPEPQLAELAALARIRRLAAGETLFRKGEESRALYVVLRGRIRISSGSAEGREAVLNLLAPGETFGEVALVDGGQRTADAAAVEPVVLAGLDRRDLVPFLQARPELMLRMLAALSERLRWVSESFEDALFLELPARLAKRLLFLSARFGVDTPRGRRLTVPLPQHELAGHMNVARETVNRQLRAWRAEGLIALDQGVVVLADLDRLAAIARGPSQE